MKFTRNILKEILPIDLITNESLYQALNDIGLEVESFKEISAPKNVVVGKILECQKHPDADKLNVCQVAISGEEGAYEIRQIVCGAPNAREGIFVAVAQEGAKLPQITIKKAKLRGVESNGMLCSTTELDFPKVNDGIIELDESIGELIIGKELSEYPLFDDCVFEISITPNRGDCMNLNGIAREIGAYFHLEKKAYKVFKDSENMPGIGRVLQITNADKCESSLAYRAVEASPIKLSYRDSLFLAYNDLLMQDWLKNILNLGILHTGVILNAYPQNFCQLSLQDSNKVILQVKKDERGFDSIFLEDKKLSSVGIENYTSKDCKEILNKEFIVLEASYVSPEIIAQKVLETKAKVDTKIFQRSSRGSGVDLFGALNFISGIFLSDEESILYSDMHDLSKFEQKAPIAVDISMISKSIGIDLERTKVVNILKALEFGVEISSEDSWLMVRVPNFRHDIVSAQDISEEIIRFIGIDNVPSAPLKLVQSNQSNHATQTYFFRRNLAKKAIGSGFNEALHFVFGDEEKFKKYGYEVLREDLGLLNPITNELNTLRPSLLLALLQAAQKNANNAFSAISFFEMGSVYDKERNESVKMAFLQSGFIKEERYPNPKGIMGNFFDFADRIANVIGDFSLEETQSKIALFHPNQCAKILKEGREIGILASLHPEATKDFDLGQTFLCEIDVEKLNAVNPKVKMHSKFQKTIRDLSVVISKNIPYFEISKSIRALKLANVTSFYPLDVYCDEELEDKMSLTLRFELQSDEKTLEEKDISLVMDCVLKALQDTYGVELR